MNIAFIQGIGPLELSIVLVIVLVIFGPKRLPALARSMGTGMREFKHSISSRHEAADDAPGDGEEESRAALGRPEEPVRAEKPVAAEARGEAIPERR